MTPAELRAVSALGGHVFGGVASLAEQVHRAIAGRAFGLAGPAAAAAEHTHDACTRSAYGLVRGAGALATTVTGEIMSLLGASGESASSTPGGNQAIAALNAVTGDRLGAEMAALAIGMAVRAGGRDIDPSTAELSVAFPCATSRLAVFVHGLAETEDSWRRRDGDHVPYGERLRAEFGYTPVYVRYNSGRHISDNGTDLSELLTVLVAQWPEGANEILLVGHSMGGLVIRAACQHAQSARAAWAERVGRVFYLGSPHLGAPLARAAGFAGLALGQVAETRPFVRLVNGSSAGIKDLRYGYVHSRDWVGCDTDRCVRDHRSDVPLLAGAEHYAISATVSSDPGSPLGVVVGDLLVRPASAHGRRRGRQHVPFGAGSGRGLGGMHHLDLLNHPQVWTTIRDILDRPDQ